MIGSEYVARGTVATTGIGCWIERDRPHFFCKSKSESRATMKIQKRGDQILGLDDMFATASELFDRGAKQKAYALFLQAASCKLQAAELGHSHAQHNVALLLELGEGVKRDISAAIKWYRRSWRNNPQKGTAENLAALYLEIGNHERYRYWRARSHLGHVWSHTRAIKPQGPLESEWLAAVAGPVSRGVWGGVVSDLMTTGTKGVIDFADARFGDCTCAR